MKENKYDNEEFFLKYSQMDRSKRGLKGAGEWSELQKVLPDFASKRVLDLGCGYGWHCIYAAEHGAESVTGIDISEKMLETAGEKKAMKRSGTEDVPWKIWTFQRNRLMWSSAHLHSIT